MKQIGMTSNPAVNNGEPVPLYELSGSINTLEGWNKLVLERATPRFIAEYGRKPINDDEVFAHNRSYCDAIVAACEREAKAVQHE